MVNSEKKVYSPLEVELLAVYGIRESLIAMRLPKMTEGDTISAALSNHPIIGKKDMALATNLVKAGTDHGKFSRGIIAWIKLEMQAGWMIEFETYRHGVECLSTSSAMHMDLGDLKGADLAEKKQVDLASKVYTRICTVSYQALRSMYKARRNHRHPDWQIMCDFIEDLPHSESLITI